MIGWPWLFDHGTLTPVAIRFCSIMEHQQEILRIFRFSLVRVSFTPNPLKMTMHIGNVYV